MDETHLTDCQYTPLKQKANANSLPGISCHTTDAVESVTTLRLRGLRNARNPFNAQTTLQFEIQSPQQVWLEMFDARGRHVRTLLHGARLLSQSHAVVWDGRDDAGVACGSSPPGTWTGKPVHVPMITQE
jgi:hypothetical protein